MSRISFIRQHESMQWRAACLLMVYRYYSMCASLSEIDSMRVIKEGISSFWITETDQSLWVELKPMKDQQPFSCMTIIERLKSTIIPQTKLFKGAESDNAREIGIIKPDQR